MPARKITRSVSAGSSSTKSGRNSRKASSGATSRRPNIKSSNVERTTTTKDTKSTTTKTAGSTASTASKNKKTTLKQQQHKRRTTFNSHKKPRNQTVGDTPTKKGPLNPQRKKQAEPKSADRNMKSKVHKKRYSKSKGTGQNNQKNNKKGLTLSNAYNRLVKRAPVHGQKETEINNSDSVIMLKRNYPSADEKEYSEGTDIVGDVELDLQILRGRNLNSNNPSARIIIRDSARSKRMKIIGETPIRTPTQNLEIGDSESSFSFQTKSNCRLIIQIMDMEVYDDKTFSKVVVSFVEMRVSEWIKWATDPTNSLNWTDTINKQSGKKAGGKLQIKIKPVISRNSEDLTSMSCNDGILLDNNLDQPIQLQRVRGGTRKKKDFVPESTESAPIPTTICIKQSASVVLNVYDIYSSVSALNICGKLLGSGGFFHAAIEVFGREYSYGCTGIITTYPKHHQVHCYCESIPLGDCSFTYVKVKSLIRKMKSKWEAQFYGLLSKNCCTFCQELSSELGVKEIPSWVSSLSKAVQPIVKGNLSQMTSCSSSTESLPSVSP
mmetsp:Transcript_17266/g.19930  ORF Transcript_17266/g.19930 Transcript_17266/m.19930 type:complete len:551 (-) Transcript_17266:286-1938(-)